MRSLIPFVKPGDYSLKRVYGSGFLLGTCRGDIINGGESDTKCKERFAVLR